MLKYELLKHALARNEVLWFWWGLYCFGMIAPFVYIALWSYGVITTNGESSEKLAWLDIIILILSMAGMIGGMILKYDYSY